MITNADKMLIAAKKAGVANTAHDDLAGIIKRKIIAAKTVHIAATIMYLVNCFCILFLNYIFDKQIYTRRHRQ